MAAFVDGQEHFMHLIQDEHQTYAMSGQIRKRKDRSWTFGREDEGISNEGMGADEWWVGWDGDG